MDATSPYVTTYRFSSQTITVGSDYTWDLTEIPLRKGDLWAHLLGLYFDARMSFTTGATAANQQEALYCLSDVQFIAKGEGHKSERRCTGLGLRAMFARQTGRNILPAGTITNLDVAATSTAAIRRVETPMLFFEPGALNPFEYLQALAQIAPTVRVALRQPATSGLTTALNNSAIQPHAIVAYLPDYLVGPDTMHYYKDAEQSGSGSGYIYVEPGNYRHLFIHDEVEATLQDHGVYTDVWSDDGRITICDAGMLNWSDQIYGCGLPGLAPHVAPAAQAAIYGAFNALLDYGATNGPTLDFINLAFNRLGAKESGDTFNVPNRVKVNWNGASLPSTTRVHWLKVNDVDDAIVQNRAAQVARQFGLAPRDLRPKVRTFKKQAVTPDQTARIPFLRRLSRKIPGLSRPNV